MTVLTTQAALALIAMHQCVSPAVAPIIVGIAQHESGLRTTAVHDNLSGKSYFPDTIAQAVITARSLIAIGHSSLDLGVAQVNTSNFGWTGLTLETAFDPCRSFAAGAAVLFARYNGSPPPAVAAAYAQGVSAAVKAQPAEASIVPVAPPESVVITPGDRPEPVSGDPCIVPKWDVWGEQACKPPSKDTTR